MSPDGATAAVGGWTGASDQPIYLFDRATGNLTRSIDGLPNVVHHLSYSPDGRFLAAALVLLGHKIDRSIRCPKLVVS
jgi:WD40 repeat protein